jgi:ribonuclease P protein component
VRWYGRLRRSGEIAFVRRRGRQAALSTLSAYAAAETVGGSRVGITVSKAVGGSVVRNLIRRRIRGALEALPVPERPVRLLFVAKPAAAAAGYSRLAADVAAALARVAAAP